jgi:outer membrane murein-binding lipoprotein Lpp
MKKLVFVLMVLFLCGCASKTGNTEISALQTQVADLSAANQTAQEEISSSAVAVQEDEDAFVLELTGKLTEKGWQVSNLSGNTFGVTTPDDGIYLVEYDYQTEKVSRVVIYSLWTGVGTSNLEPEVLSIVNQANDEQFLAKVSVDSEGDFWLETVLPFSTQLDVNFFCDYVQWFEENESVLLLTYFQDYLQK